MSEKKFIAAEIRPLTHETAEKLAEAFECMQEGSKSNLEYIKRVRENIERVAINAAAARHADYAKCIITANFLTRWYWKRKFAESEKNMRELARIIK
jgi:hypothetical protein